MFHHHFGHVMFPYLPQRAMNRKNCVPMKTSHDVGVPWHGMTIAHQNHRVLVLSL